MNQNYVATRELDDKDTPAGFDQWLLDDHAKSTKAPKSGDVWIYPFYRTGEYCYNHDLSTRSQPRENDREAAVTTAGKRDPRQNAAEKTKTKKTAKETDSTDTLANKTKSPTTSASPTNKCTQSNSNVQYNQSSNLNQQHKHHQHWVNMVMMKCKILANH